MLSEMRGAEAEAPPYPTIGAALQAQAGQRPRARALSFPQAHQAFTFSQWHDEAVRVAHALRAVGVAPGEHVALLAENRIEWPVVQAAVALCGAVLVPVNTHFERDELCYVLGHCQTRVLFLSARFRSHAYLETVQALRPELPHLQHLVVLDGPRPGCIDYRSMQGAQAPLPAVAPAAIAGVLYTSGTTGFPKGTLLSHRAMLFDAWQVTKRLGVVEGDRWTSMIPLFHCAGCIMAVLGSLQRGGCYVGVAGFTPECMFSTIEAERCTVFSAVPTAYLAMHEHPARKAYDLSSLRTGTCGGADANPAVLRACARDFPMPYLVNLYGQTESATAIATPSFDDEDRFDTVGPVLDGCELRITGPESRAVLALGEIGQIEVRGPMVMHGYHAEPEATAATIDAHGWMQSGDLGYITERGKLCLAGGRLRDMIIRGGENLYPVEIENHLMAHPAVRQAAVFGVPDRYYGEVPAAALTLREPIDADGLRAHCAGRLARFKIPARWFLIDAFPQTASGKIRKVALQAQVADGALQELR